MSQNSNPNYTYVTPQPNSFQAAYRQYGQQPNESFPYQSKELKPGSKGKMANSKVSKDKMLNMKYDYGSPKMYPSSGADPKDPSKQYASRFPKVTNEEVQNLLLENYSIMKAMNDSMENTEQLMDDPEFTL
ncbi:conserved hypothetical protein [Theileria orientalis strain Shintoku]|uniref:Uncharacterized protein n=1 Tax=Theileria orientalis strain Shintoku TaxID=869250 RepID=J4C3I3_THEOR|nr:conserved hypothetical protein [Theileria orientalis strain Shintoku]BAM40491.1 conserved hypothetical protein [Theileria orientalis strain Shintoku]|eukprot:XP_009690792.1 conserved hypothetical protein [Theileria orientalis strain Shintoku]